MTVFYKLPMPSPSNINQVPGNADKKAVET
jgi:hypothetical protein